MVTSVTVTQEFPGSRTEDWIRTRRLCSFPVLLACVLMLSTYLVFPKTIADPDLGWHLRNAEYMLNQHQVVRRDMFSSTTFGKPWIDHEWMSEIPFYLGWKLAGMQGVFLVTIGLIETVFLGIFGLAYEHSKSAKSAFIVSFLAIVPASVSFGPRTLLFGWICLLAELTILLCFRNGRDITWLLPPLFLVWVNLHGSWMIGLVLLGIFLGSGLAEGEWGLIYAVRWSRNERRRLAGMSLLSVLALFVNPYGWRLTAYPFDMAFRQKLNIEHVEEWRTVDFHSPRGKIILVMMVGTILLQLVRRRKWRLDEICFALVGMYAGLTYSRFLFLSAILICPLISTDLCGWMPQRAKRDRPWLNAGLMACCLTAIILRLPTEQQLAKAGCAQYPCEALQYLRNFHPDGKVFNDFRWGGYLIWNTPQVPVFIDSRVDIFEHHGVLADYLHVVQLGDSLQILNHNNIRYVLFEKNTPLSYFLMHVPGWKIDYRDSKTVLFERTRDSRQEN